MRLFSLAPVGGRKSKSSAADRDWVWQAQQQMVCWNAQLRCSIEANSRRHDSGVGVVTATGADARRWSGTVAQPWFTFACCLELKQNYDKNTAFFFKKKRNVSCLDVDSDSRREAVRQLLNWTIGLCRSVRPATESGNFAAFHWKQRSCTNTGFCSQGTCVKSRQVKFLALHRTDGGLSSDRCHVVTWHLMVLFLSIYLFKK